MKRNSTSLDSMTFPIIISLVDVKSVIFQSVGGEKNLKSCSERYRLVLLVKYTSPLKVGRLFFSKGSVPKLIKKNQCENINPRPKVNCKHLNWDNKLPSCGQVSVVPMRSLSGLCSVSLDSTSMKFLNESISKVPTSKCYAGWTLSDLETGKNTALLALPRQVGKSMCKHILESKTDKASLLCLVTEKIIILLLRGNGYKSILSLCLFSLKPRFSNFTRRRICQNSDCWAPPAISDSVGLRWVCKCAYPASSQEMLMRTTSPS